MALRYPTETTNPLGCACRVAGARPSSVRHESDHHVQVQHEPESGGAELLHLISAARVALAHDTFDHVAGLVFILLQFSLRHLVQVRW